MKHVFEPSVEHRKLLQRFHVLVDKQLEDDLSPDDQAELDSIKTQIDLVESSASAQFDAAAEKRHQEMLQQLGELVHELRKFRSHGELQAESR